MDSRLIIVALVAYLLGSIPFGYILVKLFLKQDIRQTGSGNIGATNVARSGKKGLAIATLMLDAAKGALAVGLAWRLNYYYWLGSYYPHVTWEDYSSGARSSNSNFVLNIGNEALVFLAVASLFAIVGHMFPVWLKFKGGKGVAAAVGAFAILSPRGVLAAIACFAVVFAITRYVSLGSILSATIFPIAAYYAYPETPSLAVLVVMLASSLLIILRHHANIRRLIAGTEPKFGKQAIGTTDPIQTEKNI